MEKPFYKSRTLWVNGISFVVAILFALGLVETELSSDLAQFVAPAVFLINLVLRFVTKEPVSL